jgi:glutamate formiminotransferase/formiminotetrahydrofolate cyclodeaminase
VKAIGWFIEEYGIAQVSLNLTDISVTPIHLAFEEVCEKAAARGIRVTGSEIVGLVPLRALLDAGRHYLTRQGRSHGIPDEEIVRIAVRSLGLDDVKPFDPHQKIIEWRLRGAGPPGLTGRTVTAYVHQTAAESPAPGGGSAAALAGALGAALGTMLGPSLGGVLRLGGAGPGLPRGPARPGGRGHPGLRRPPRRLPIA